MKNNGIIFFCLIELEMIKFLWNWIYSFFLPTKIDQDTNDDPIKVGLLVGCNYKNTNMELKGCINDVDTMFHYLFRKLDYDYLLTLTDDTVILPTKKNILEQLQIMSSRLESGDFLFFHCSGHGTQILDRNKEEMDGKDEVFIGLDGLGITDDEFASIFSSIQCKATIFIVMDCCHSGTIIDLPYSLLEPNGKIIKNNSKKFHSNIVMISGCRDPNVSYDTLIHNKYQGALTFSLNTALQNFKSTEPIPLRKLLEIIHRLLKEKNYPQLPQLSFSHSTITEIEM